MAKFFPIGQVMGFVFSLVLTVIALLVYYTDMSFTTGMIVLLVTAFLQAALQFTIFMHAGETEDQLVDLLKHRLRFRFSSCYGSRYIFNPSLGYVIKLTIN